MSIEGSIQKILGNALDWIPLNDFLGNLSDEQFQTLIDSIQMGQVSTTGMHYYDGCKEKESPNHSRIDLGLSPWQNWHQTIRTSGDGALEFWLTENVSQAVVQKILLSVKDLRAVFRFKNAGGRPPAMSPKVWAYLTVKFAHDTFGSAEEELTNLELLEDLWTDGGMISNGRGIEYMKEYLNYVPLLEQMYFPE
ncbi:MAG: hypothetical protein OSA78_07225 [Flavobacteriales bacterium]|nr:hypothetical protein [Flavobacteriales bacterium]